MHVEVFDVPGPEGGLGQRPVGELEPLDSVEEGKLASEGVFEEVVVVADPLTGHLSLETVELHGAGADGIELDGFETDVLGQDHQGVVGQPGEDGRADLGQLQHDRLVVRRREALDLGGKPTGVGGLHSFRRESVKVQGVDDVAGREGSPVVELDAWHDFHGEGGAVVGELPAAEQLAGYHLVALIRVEDDQVVVQRLGRVGGRRGPRRVDSHAPRPRRRPGCPCADGKDAAVAGLVGRWGRRGRHGTRGRCGSRPRGERRHRRRRRCGLEGGRGRRRGRGGRRRLHPGGGRRFAAAAGCHDQAEGHQDARKSKPTPLHLVSHVWNSLLRGSLARSLGPLSPQPVNVKMPLRLYQAEGCRNDIYAISECQVFHYVSN